MDPVQVLIVEDDKRVADIQRLFTEKVPGFTVIGISHALQEAEEMLTVLKPDLVLLDIYFPEGNGIETYLHTPWYIPQPHSFEFDLDMTDEEVMKFTEEHCRADPGFMMASEREAKMAAMMGL